MYNNWCEEDYIVSDDMAKALIHIRVFFYEMNVNDEVKKHCQQWHDKFYVASLNK